MSNLYIILMLSEFRAYYFKNSIGFDLLNYP